MFIQILQLFILLSNYSYLNYELYTLFTLHTKVTGMYSNLYSPLSLSHSATFPFFNILFIFYATHPSLDNHSPVPVIKKHRRFQYLTA